MNNCEPLVIWDQFVSGDHTCFEKLFMHFYKGLFSYGLTLCRDRNLVEDSIQNLFLMVWERRDDLTHITSPNVYLYVSLRRSIFKTKQRREREKEFSENVHDQFYIEFAEEDIIIKKESLKEKKSKLAEALNQLSNQQKEVLYLHYYNGMSYGEIEEILSINRQSVRNHMYRAIQTLRTVLDVDVMRLVITILVAVLFI